MGNGLRRTPWEQSLGAPPGSAGISAGVVVPDWGRDRSSSIGKILVRAGILWNSRD